MSTATKALAWLKAEQLTRAERGRGTVVHASGLHRTAHDYAVAVLRTGRIYPPGHYAGNIRAELVPAPEHVAHALAVQRAGAELLAIEVVELGVAVGGRGLASGHGAVNAGLGVGASRLARMRSATGTPENELV